MVLRITHPRLAGLAGLAGLALVLGPGCSKAVHDVGCGDFLGMSDTDQAEVVESFLDDHPLGRLTFGEDESQQASMALMSLQAYCSENPGTNIDDLEPDLVPGL